MNIKQFYKNIPLVSLVLFLLNSGCQKSFLDIKPSTSIVIPKTLKDLQQMLNSSALGKAPSLPILSCDDYIIPNDADWAAMLPTERNCYIWDENTYGGELKRNDWNQPFETIFFANSVLSLLRDISKTSINSTEHSYVNGQAYFFRAFAFFELAKSFAPPYDPKTADTDLGLPLKLTPNIDEIQPRSSVASTYAQIISDLSKAAPLLPDQISSSKNRPSKPAAYALFSRLSLSMRDYINAERYADSCLSLYDKLIDYNTISKTATTPFLNTNDEIIFYSIMTSGYNNSLSNAFTNISINPVLLNLYATDDLRRAVYYLTDAKTNLVKTKRSYSALTSPFSGLATDEIFLIKAECAARRNDVNTALKYLNDLLIKRFATNKFEPYYTTSASNALSKILEERRKELVWRSGIRWDDLRRLNKEGAGITLTRNINQQSYILPPNDLRYTFLIPEDEVSLSSLQQNPR